MDTSNMMTESEILALFQSTGALLEGHFLLSSGLHSPQYFQCAKVLQYPWHAEAICRGIAQTFQSIAGDRIDVVISPAIGGIIVGQEVARHLHVRSIFAERSQGVMTLRRGFELQPGERVLICEDVTTTGGSVMELIGIARNAGAKVVGVSSIVDRSGGTVNFGKIPFIPQLRLKALTYAPHECPLCEQNIPLVKPGSRDDQNWNERNGQR